MNNPGSRTPATHQLSRLNFNKKGASGDGAGWVQEGAVEPKSSIQDGQVLGKIVEDHNPHEQDEEDKAHLKDAFLDTHAEVAPNEPFYGKQCDYTTIQNGYRHQIENT